jgi:hypothetical protein
MVAGAKADLKVFRKERNRTMLLASFENFVLRSVGIVMVCVAFYGWLISKVLAKNPGVKKAAGAKVISVIANWLK